MYFFRFALSTFDLLDGWPIFQKEETISLVGTINTVALRLQKTPPKTDISGMVTTQQGFSYHSEVRTKGLLNLGKNILTIKMVIDSVKKNWAANFNRSKLAI